MTSAPASGRRRVACCVLLATAAAPAGAVLAQEPPPPRSENLNLYGMTGLIDLPSARVQPDGQFSVTSSYFGGFMRNTLNFQVLPRVEAAFRYSILQDYFQNSRDLFDRSFDVKVLISDETPWFPAVAVGLRDFLGTGVYSSEFVVATKTVAPGLDVTGGFGWGRLAGTGTLENPLGYAFDRFKTRDSKNLGTGKVNFGQFFRGPDMGVFAGVEWRPEAVEGLTLTAEYSTDAYINEQKYSDFDTAIPFNFGASYKVTDWLTLGAYAMYGSEFGIRASIGVNPAVSPGARDSRYPPHAPRVHTSKPMARVFGEAPSEGSVHGHRTRSGARCRVRLRLEVPNERVLKMFFEGWVTVNRRERTRNCDECVFREY